MGKASVRQKDFPAVFQILRDAMSLSPDQFEHGPTKPVPSKGFVNIGKANEATRRLLTLYKVYNTAGKQKISGACVMMAQAEMEKQFPNMKVTGKGDTVHFDKDWNVWDVDPEASKGEPESDTLESLMKELGESIGVGRHSSSGPRSSGDGLEALLGSLFGGKPSSSGSKPPMDGLEALLGNLFGGKPSPKPEPASKKPSFEELGGALGGLIDAVMQVMNPNKKDDEVARPEGKKPLKVVELSDKEKLLPAEERLTILLGSETHFDFPQGMPEGIEFPDELIQHLAMQLVSVAEEEGLQVKRSDVVDALQEIMNPKRENSKSQPK